MDEFGIQHLYQFDQIANAVDVRDQRLVKRRIELHQPSRIDDDIYGVGQCLKPLGGNATHGSAQIAFHNRCALPNCVHTDAFHNRLQGRRFENFAEEPLFTRDVFFWPDLNDEVSQVRKPVQHHGE